MEHARRRFILFFLVMVGFVGGCQRTPITGRRALLLLSAEQEAQLGAEAFEQIRAEETVSRNFAAVHTTKVIGWRIALETQREDWDWTFTLFEGPDNANAFALPGGKVGVYTGMFPIAENEAGLAAVLGHEIAHALARHGGQRISQQLLIELGLTAAQLSLENVEQRRAILSALGLGAVIGIQLPYSRRMELEADRIGMILMARAGYDPRETIDLWERFAEQMEADAPPTWLSTHPPTQERIERLREFLPEAMEEYEQAAQQYGHGSELPAIEGEQPVGATGLRRSDP